MRKGKLHGLEPGDDVIVLNPVDRRTPRRAKLLGLRNGGRTAVVQDPYEWGTTKVPAVYVVPDA